MDRPTLGYTVFTALGFLAAFFVKRAEERRLGYRARPGYRWVAAFALGGAVVGSKLGMLLYLDVHAWWRMLSDLAAFRVEGKTVLGALAGGYVGVEIGKRLVGVRGSTGDAFAIALPVGQAIGRLGCFVGGCCYGAPTDLVIGVHAHGALRHPAPLYEAALDLALATLLFAVRERPRPEGHLFRGFLVGYGVIRFALDPFRGDPCVRAFGLSLAQWLCLLTVVAFGTTLARGRKLEDALART